MRFLLLACLFLSLPAFAASKPIGVRGDGIYDDTSALQTALNSLSKIGGTLALPPGQYVIGGSLKIPTGVTFKGAWEAPHHGAYEKGTTLLLMGGRGNENAPPAITLQQSSAVRGFTLLWPQQKWPHIVPYPWAIQGVGMHNTVENITFVNAYNGIRIGHIAGSELHLVRNVFGCVLRRGVFIDSTTDIGRLENVHFNPHYWNRSGHASRPPQDGNPDLKIADYTTAHLEAFIFGRSDWQSVTSCFVFGAKIGFHFIRTPSGAANAQLVGVGADVCRTAVQIDELQRLGVQFTNSTFMAAGGPPGLTIVTTPMAGGAATFLNCTFWEAPGGIAQLDGLTNVNFSDCQFFGGAKNGAIRAAQGFLTVRGCTFSGQLSSVVLKPDVRAAIITGNMQAGGLKVQNEIGERAQIGLNEIAPSRRNDGLYKTGVWMILACVLLMLCLVFRAKSRRAKSIAVNSPL